MPSLTLRAIAWRALGLALPRRLFASFRIVDLDQPCLRTIYSARNDELRLHLFKQRTGLFGLVARERDTAALSQCSPAPRHGFRTIQLLMDVQTTLLHLVFKPIIKQTQGTEEDIGLVVVICAH
jgi:hypothetical protein